MASELKPDWWALSVEPMSLLLSLAFQWSSIKESFSKWSKMNLILILFINKPVGSGVDSKIFGRPWSRPIYFLFFHHGHKSRYSRSTRSKDIFSSRSFLSLHLEQSETYNLEYTRNPLQELTKYVFVLRGRKSSLWTILTSNGLPERDINFLVFVPVPQVTEQVLQVDHDKQA